MKNFLTKLRVPVGWVYFILIGIVGNVKNINYFIGGLILIFVGEFIRTLSSGVIKKNETICSQGCYGIIRHPLYFGSCLIGLGFALLVNNPIVWIYLGVFFILTYVAAIKSEEEYLLNKFGNAYIKYQKKVPCFFPLLNDILGNYKHNFSFHQFKKNKEYKNWIIIVVVLSILAFKIYLYR
jgi:protein-S-isoprenylcysteine O-methyltransferase Ste14